jgi:predicted MFS family arabinose efflux permease
MKRPKGSIVPLLKVRNIRFSMVLATLNMTSYVALLGFGPLYLVNVAKVSNATMAAAMTGIGVVGVFFAFVGPMLSDRFGRKPAIFGAYAISIVGALMMVLAGARCRCFFAGTLLAAAGGAGTGALIMAIIPGESAPPHLKGTAMGVSTRPSANCSERV